MSESKRNELFEELIEFLRERRKKKNGFFRHPFVLMLVGSLIAAGLTTWWAAREQRNLLELQFQRAKIEQQYSLLEKIPAHFHKTGSHLNAWFQFLIAVAEESIKPEDERNTLRIDFCRKEGQEAQKNFIMADPFGAKLEQVKVIFKSEKIKNTATSMSDKWSQLVERVNQSNRKYNARKVTKNDIEEWHTYRVKTIDELEILKNELVIHMSSEIVASY